MNSIYYFAAWTDSGFLLGCQHQHATVTEAAGCISACGSYIIAVENGVLREANELEEAEFQHVLCARPTPEPVKLRYEVSSTTRTYPSEGGIGYAVMVRLSFVDGWGWGTWMRYDTEEEAVAHAWDGTKVVPFGSAEWTALLSQSREPALPAPVSAPPPRLEAQTLDEFVARLVPSPIDPQDQVDKDPAVPVGSESVRGAGTEPKTFFEFVLEWINKWELTFLEKMYSLQVPPWIEPLQKHVRKALKRRINRGISKAYR